jgi:hypothetical protein
MQRPLALGVARLLAAVPGTPLTGGGVFHRKDYFSADVEHDPVTGEALMHPTATTVCPSTTPYRTQGVALKANGFCEALGTPSALRPRRITSSVSKRSGPSA